MKQFFYSEIINGGFCYRKIKMVILIYLLDAHAIKTALFLL